MMKRTHVEDVTDEYDQEVAQLVHRLSTKRLVIELENGGYVTFERTPDPNQHLFEDLSCPDCGTAVYWSEDQLDYVHEHIDQAKACWLNRNKVEGS